MKRLLWIDALRGIAIILVVYGHCVHGWSEFYKLTTPVKMPLFFVLSGYLFNPRQGNERAFYRNVFFRYVIPWVVLGLLPYTDILHRLQSLLSGEKLWFMPCFIICEIIWFYINKFAKNSSISIIVFAVFSCIIGFVLNHFHLLRYAMINTAFIVQIYLAMGFLLKKKEQEITKQWKTWACVMIMVYVFLVALTLNCYLDKPFDIHLNHYFNIPICMLMIGTGCVAMFTVFRVCNIAPNWLVYVGQNSLLIYIMHGFAFAFFNYLFRHQLSDYLPLPAYAGMKTIFACVICCALAFFMNRYTPILVGKNGGSSH